LQRDKNGQGWAERTGDGNNKENTNENGSVFNKICLKLIKMYKTPEYFILYHSNSNSKLFISVQIFPFQK